MCSVTPAQVEECHLPGLGVALTLDYKPDSADEAVSPLVSFVSGLLLGTSGKVRTWFGMFIRNGQQVGALPSPPLPWGHHSKTDRHDAHFSVLISV